MVIRDLPADVDHFTWPDGGDGLPDFSMERLIMSKAIPSHVDDHNSKSER